MKLVESSGYKEDRKKIMDSTYKHIVEEGNSPKRALEFFRSEEKGLVKRIKSRFHYYD